MAPEQADSHGEVGPATDVWALGLLAFTMLSGCHYWRAAKLGDDRRAAVLLREILIDALPAASERASILGGRGLPDGFDAWFARCVAREREERFATSREAWNALAPILGAEPLRRSMLPPPVQSVAGAASVGTDRAGLERSTQDTSSVVVASRPGPGRWTGLALAALAGGCVIVALAAWAGFHRAANPATPGTVPVVLASKPDVSARPPPPPDAPPTHPR